MFRTGDRAAGDSWPVSAVSCSSPGRNACSLSRATLLGAGLPGLGPAKAGTVLGSSTDAGRTTDVARNDAGSHTVMVSDREANSSWSVHGRPAAGPTGISIDDGQRGCQPCVPPVHSSVIGSGTDQGRTTVVTLNHDGTHRVTVTARAANATSSVPLRPPGGPGGMSSDAGHRGFKPYVPGVAH